MNPVGTVSYAVAAVAFLVLTVLLSVSWRGRRPGAYLIAASAITAVWAMLLTAASRGGVPILLVYILEMLRNAAWLLALTVIAKVAAPPLLLNLVRGTCIVVVAGAVAIPFFGPEVLTSGEPLLLLSRAGLVTSLLGLVLLEQIYRNSTESSRTALRFMALGVGGLFVYDLFLYSQVELLRGVTEDSWNARGLLNAFAAPLIALAVRRYPEWSLDIFVSRQVVFYTSTFMGVGAYLLLMAVGGFYVREIGGAWGQLGQIMFFAGALVVLFFLVASPSLRRHARVFISKHFYRNKYDYRIEWLRFISTLSSGQEEGVQRTSICAIAQIFSSPAGVLFMLDEPANRFEPAAAWPMRVDDIEGIAAVGAEEDLPRFLNRTSWIVDLLEFKRTPDIYDHLTLPEWITATPNLRMISPLLQLERVVGFVLLYDPPPPFELTYEDRDLLKTVGRHVATHLAQHDADRRLAESAQFEAYNRLTAFMMHDLKNSVAQLKLIVANAERHKRNPEFIDDAIGTIANTVERMTRLIEQLTAGSTAPRVSSVDLSKLASDAVVRCSGRRPEPVLSASQAAPVRADPERLTAIIEHLIRNAQDASAETDSISVEVGVRQNDANLVVRDTGRGMAKEFVRERLFRPFDSTKGSKGMGIGAYQVREYVRMVGGQVEVQSSPGLGTRFSITLPLIQQTSSVDADSISEPAIT